MALALVFGVLSFVDVHHAYGEVPSFSAPGWVVNGSTTLIGDVASLTDTSTAGERGSIFWHEPIAMTGMTATFDIEIGGGTGADGLAMVLADPAAGASPSSLGRAGGGLGFDGIPGVAVAFDTFGNLGSPTGAVVGLSVGSDGSSALSYPSSAPLPTLRSGTHHVEVDVGATRLTVRFDGVSTLTADASVPPLALLGFTAATGALTDVHTVRSIAVTPAAGSATDVAPLGTSGWTLQGTATPEPGGVRLTAATDRDAAGSTFWPTPVPVEDGLRLSFDAQLAGESPVGADGLALVLGDVAAGASSTSIGAPSSGLGFIGIPGVAVALDTYRNTGEPGADLVGITQGGNGQGALEYLATAPVAAMRGPVHHVEADVTAGHIVVRIDGASALSSDVNLPDRVLVGFTASVGGYADNQTVTNFHIAAASSLETDPNVVWMWTMDNPNGYRSTIGTGFDENFTQTLSAVPSPAPSGGQNNGNVMKVRFPVSESGVAHDQYTGYGVAMRRRFSALNLTPQRSLHLRYSMFIPKDFNPYDGGKLFSLFSHPADRPLYGPEGVSSANVYADDSWWAGIMFNGPSPMTGTYPNRTYIGDTNLDHIRIEPYVYAKQINGITMTSDSVANGQWGWNVKLRSGLNQDPSAPAPESGTGTDGYLFLNRGRWNTIEQQVIINDSGQANGVLRMWVNGTLGLNVKNVKWAADTYNASAIINGLHLDTFFGGPNSNTTDQTLYYDDVVLSKAYIGLRGALPAETMQAPAR